MFSYASFVCLLALSALAQSALVPTKPGPGEVFNTGGQCQISWNPDTTSTWTSFSVDLMSGSNLAMQPVMNVFKGKDGTKSPGGYTFTCPDVTPNSAIYFYQFTQAGADTTWTTRFTIASATGQTTPPANANQPGGQPIPWGVGTLTSAASSSNSSTTAPANNTTVAPPANANLTALTTPSTNVTTTISTNSTAPATSDPSTGSTGSTSSKAPTQKSTPAATSTSSKTGSSGSSTTSGAVSRATFSISPLILSVIIVALFC